MLKIKNYKVMEQIYESGNSLVYRGTRDLDGQAVILKLLQGEYPTLQQLSHYRQEFEITRSLNLAGVAQVYELLPYRNSLVMVLEDFGGQSLKSLKLGGTLSLEAFLRLAIELSHIVGQVHQAQIMHKDINPANVVYNPVTKVMKLIDFGISSRLSREYTTFRNPSGLEGTLAYISPEQTGRMNRAIDYRTDLYSLGVTLYELWTGRLPFEESDPLALVHAHIAKTPRLELGIRGQELGGRGQELGISLIPNAQFLIPLVSDIIMKLLAKNAEDRYQSAYGLKWDLEQLLSLALSEGVYPHPNPLPGGEGVAPHPRPLPGGEGVLNTPLLLGEGPGVRVQLGARDFSGRFQIPQKLYGREKEIETLLTSFAQVSQANSTSELLLIAGYSGVGKSALVHEVHKPITAKQGYFVSGKYDQFQRNVPYYALTQALNEFCQLLLAEPEANLAHWRERILTAAGHNGQVLIEVIPNLEWVIGAQPPVSELGPQEAQNRFNLIFQNFMQAICQPEHPVVLFIDDLQWADMASLELLKQVLSNPYNTHLLIIGAYRDNEVEVTHPFMLMLNELKRLGVTMQTITLPNLTVAEVTALVAETLHADPKTVGELVSLLYEKTQGNAFFVTQFLISLYEQGYLTFDYNLQAWQWEMGRIRELNISDNVVELMARKLVRLDTGTQTMLKLVACVGNKFALSTLAMISEQSPLQALNAMWPAVEEGLLLPLDENYRRVWVETTAFEGAAQVDSQFKFLHDRVQQAAYSLIAEADRVDLHLRIGRLWWARATNLEEKLFDVVNQLNAGRELMETEAERVQLAELNLWAGQRAKESAAYVLSLQYLTVGLTLLPPDKWQRFYPLSLKLHTETAQAAYLGGDFNTMDTLLEQVMGQVTEVLDKVEIYVIKLLAYMGQHRQREALAVGLEGLALLGVSFPAQPVWADVQAALAQTQARWQGRHIPDLINLPELTDPYQRAALRILTTVMPATYQTNPLLTPLIICEQASIALEYGHCPDSAAAYASYTIMLGGVVEDIEASYAFGELATQLVERFHWQQVYCRVWQVVVSHGLHWKVPIRNTLPIITRATQVGLETGDFQYVAFSFTSMILHTFYAGGELSVFETEIRQAIQISQRINQHIFVSWGELARLTVCNLLGRSQNPLQLQSDLFDERVDVAAYEAKGDRLALFMFYQYKAMLRYLLGGSGEALYYSRLAATYLDNVPGNLFTVWFWFWHALICLQNDNAKDGAALLQEVEVSLAKYALWVKVGPSNFEPHYILIQAEKARVLGQNEAALNLYDEAIALAKAHEFTHLEALANELAAKFWLGLNKPYLASHYLREARYCYQQWGAAAKVKQLESLYPELRVSIQNRSIFGIGTIMATTTSQHTSNTRSHLLDLASVMKASQAISSEIKLENLLETMMQIVVENAGAQRGLLILRQDKQWLLQAEIGSREGEVGIRERELGVRKEVTPDSQLPTPDPVQVLQSIPIEAIGGQSDNPKVSRAILRYVERSQKALVLNDARREGQFTQSTYIQKCQPKSILCVPMVNQGVVMGLIYLENNLSTYAFTPERVEVVKLLGTQATISLHNVQTMALQAEQERLRIENELLGRLNADKDKFFSIVAHDLKGPFLPLLGNLELLVEMADSVSPKQVKEMGTASHRAARRVYELLENLLHWARLQMGRMEYQPQRVDLAEIAARNVELLQDNATVKQITLQNQIETESWVYVDENMLDTVIRNLTNNALKFTGVGGVVSITAHPVGEFMEIAVTDTGAGMSREVQAKLFRIDQHVTTMGTGKETGTGLGLIICQEMVEKGGGRIWVESEVGQGTTVRFTVKLARAVE